MAHDPALEAHEHTEHAEHAAHEADPFIPKVTITIAVLAVLAAAAGSMETVEGGLAITKSSEAVLAQDQATDRWAEFEADSVKKNMYKIAAETDPDKAAEFKSEAKDEGDKQVEAKNKAVEHEHERDKLSAESGHHEELHHHLTVAATLIEIGIALSTVAIITKNRLFWLSALGLGAVGAVLGVLAFG
jgi:Domain of unknown function (DUF4337)